MMNLNSAFRLRNRLKEKIKELNRMVENADYEKNVGVEEAKWKLDGSTLQDLIEKTSKLMHLLGDFNEAIEKANEPNRIALIRLETLKSELAFYEGIVIKCRACKGFDYEYPDGKYSSDDMIKVIKEIVLDQSAIVKTRDNLRREKDRLEEGLARKNAEAKVDFDETQISAVI